jgi:hypothetical protein
MVSFSDFLCDINDACTLNGLPDATSDARLERALLHFFHHARETEASVHAVAQAQRFVSALDQPPKGSFIPSSVLMTFMGLDFKTNPPGTPAGKAYREVLLQLRRNGWADKVCYVGGEYKTTIRGFLYGSRVEYIGEHTTVDGVAQIKLISV